MRYSDLGVRPVINAAATLTRLGGSRMPAPVLDAMRVGAQSFVDLLELHSRVGQRIAELTRNEACYVSSGAAAGMAIVIAGCITDGGGTLVGSLPHVDGPAPEVIVFGSQRNGYDQAARQTGARIVEIGPLAGELEAALSPRTVCVLYFAGAHFAAGALPLEEVIAIAHRAGVRVFVDAAAQIPPLANLWHFTRELGADAAIFSGGKGLRGPQSTGLVLGSHGIVDACVPNGPPYHSVGRPMKVGKEEMFGILAAVEWSLQQDEGALLGRYEAMVQGWIAGLSDVPGVLVERGYPSEAGQPHARAILRLLPASGWTRPELVRALWDADPRVAVGEIGADAIALNPQTLESGEDQVVLAALRRLLVP